MRATQKSRWRLLSLTIVICSKLTTDNYSYWKVMMEDHLYINDLYEPIINQNKPEEKGEREWQLLNQKAVAMIRMYIDKTLFGYVSTCTNAFELWRQIESTVKKQTLCDKVLLVRRLVKLKYKDGQSKFPLLNSFKGLVSQLANNGVKIGDELQAFLLLNSLPDSWDPLVVTVTNSTPEGKLNMDIVSDILLNEEFMRKE